MEDAEAEKEWGWQWDGAELGLRKGGDSGPHADAPNGPGGWPGRWRRRRGTSDQAILCVVQMRLRTDSQ